MPKKPSILFITMGKNEAASRFRVKQYFSYFKKEGYKVYNFPLHIKGKHPENYGFFKYFWYFIIILRKIISIFYTPFFDIIFLQRSILKGTSPWSEKLIKIFNKNIIFDFDDAIWLNYSNKELNPVSEVIKLSKEVIVGNQFLFDYAKKFNRRVTIIPTPLETEIYKPKKREKSDLVNIGWVGTRSNLEYLYHLRPVFQKIGQKYGNQVKLTVICDKKPEFEPGIQLDFIEWSAKSELADTQRFDLGIMPLPDNDWTRGKCAFKAIQYLALGIPAIVSPVGTNNDFIAKNLVFPAKDDKDWYERICALIDEPNLRNKYKEEAREEVVNNYSVQNNFQKLITVLESFNK